MSEHDKFESIMKEIISYADSSLEYGHSLKVDKEGLKKCIDLITPIVDVLDEVSDIIREAYEL